MVYFWLGWRLREKTIMLLEFHICKIFFKAATPEGFTQRTGAIGKYYELPFKRRKNIKLHLFGFAKLHLIPLLMKKRVVSFDTAAPLRQAWEKW